MPKRRTLELALEEQLHLAHYRDHDERPVVRERCAAWQALGSTPIRAITARPSLAPASFTPWAIPVACASDTATPPGVAGLVGLTQLLKKDHIDEGG